MGYLGIFKTTIVIVYIITSIIIFERDVRTVVLDPLDVMLEIMDLVAKDPINAKDRHYLQTGFKYWKQKEDKKNNKKVPYEVNIITNSLIKISSLLATGFGEAGGEIIRKNLSSIKGLDPMIKGRKKIAIFGFCDIRNFTEINIDLEEKIMVFVNEIAEIVHTSVDKFGGAVNKNIGEAFLISWRLNENDYHVLTNGEMALDTKSRNVNQMADQALLAFLDIIMKINKRKQILTYNSERNVVGKGKAGKKFRISMGFGLQIGWAIEGAIGSSYKIDASYLSPFVNMSARLEAATRQYGVYILISGDIFDLLSIELQEYCRLIDIVTVKGSVKPMKIYTVDVNTQLKMSTRNISVKAKEMKKANRLKREKVLAGAELLNSFAKYALNKKSFQNFLIRKKTQEFYLNFKEGFDAYICGDWDKARKKLLICNKLEPNDGPTKTLFNYIQNREFRAPNNWNGFRELTSK